MAATFRGRPVILAVLCLAQQQPAAAAPRAAAECRAGAARVEILDGTGPRGEIRLASGARAVLDSLRWPDADDDAARGWLAAWRGVRLVLVPRGAPDRWARERVDAQVEQSDTDLAGGLIGAGLAYADSGEAEVLCRPALLAVEAAARSKDLGLWRLPRPSAEDGPALRALAGRFAVVEGRVRHVGERSARTYLDFVPRGTDGLTVTVTKRTWRMMAARGLSADSLEGRRVRVRGIVDLWRGPVIEAATVDAVEVLDGPSDGTPAAPAEAPGRGASGREELGLRR